MSLKDDQPLIHYCIVRSDLTIGQIGAQLGHAAGYSASYYTMNTSHYLPEHTHFICLQVKDEATLKKVWNDIVQAKIPAIPIYEPDPPLNGQMTAIGIIPCERSKVSSYTSRIPLLKERPCPKCAGTAAALPAARHDGEQQTTGRETNGS